MTLMNGEEILFESSNNELTLTTFRVRHCSSEFGSKNVVSFFLDELDSCSIDYTSYPILIIFAGLTVLLTILIAALSIFPTFEVIAPGFFITCILVFIYFYLRESVLRISSKNSHINYAFESRAMRNTIKLMDEIEAAKQHDRYRKLQQSVL